VTHSNAEIDSALAFSVSNYDGTIFELEHRRPWDAKDLRDCLQYMLNRRQIAESGSYAAAVVSRPESRGLSRNYGMLA
jgi:4-hydroxy-2-oxoheptanedioate aldolase